MAALPACTHSAGFTAAGLYLYTCLYSLDNTMAHPMSPQQVPTCPAPCKVGGRGHDHAPACAALVVLAPWTVTDISRRLPITAAATSPAGLILVPRPRLCGATAVRTLALGWGRLTVARTVVEQVEWQAPCVWSGVFGRPIAGPPVFGPPRP